MLFSPTIYLQKKLCSHSNNRIINGFFKGLKYETPNNFSFDIIAGTYEKELYPLLEKLKHFNYLIDIGAGDGYYAAGFLYKYNNLKVYAFEMQSNRKKLLLNNLDINNIKSEKCEVLDKADPQNLNAILDKIEIKNNTLIIMDVEGYEEILMDLNSIPLLKNCTILVEVHEHLVEGISELLKNRFRNTHNMETYYSRTRTVDDIKEPFNIFEKWIFKKQLESLLGEGRGTEMEWFYFEPIKITSIKK